MVTSIKTSTKNLSAIVAAAFSAAALAPPASAEDGPAEKVENSIFDFDHVSCHGGPNEVRVVVEGFEQAVGLVIVDLYRNDEEGFLRTAGRVEQRRAAAKAPRSFLCLSAPEPGQYAIAVYHDENANRTFDRGAFGIPVEPWGISNNPKIRFGPPKIDAALFTVTEDGANVAVSLN